MELILNTFGTSLNKDNNAFVISNKDGKQRIPPDGVSSIQVGRGAQITSDAILLAIDNEIEILFLDRSGEPKGRVWSAKFGSVSTIRKGQINFCFSEEAVKWIKQVIMDKIDNQQALILTFSATTASQNALMKKTLQKLEDYKNKIRGLDGSVVPDVAAQLRGWEGQSSKVYFECLNSFIPEAYQFQVRSQHPAYDVVNALLNYGYGILYGKIEGALIKSGIDPYVGIMHRDNYNRPVLVYDVIERYRIWVDYVVFTLVLQQVINDDIYSVRTDGSYWLEGLGRRILIQSLNDYMEEVVTIKSLSRSRITHIQLYTQELAQIFKSYVN